MVTVSRDYDVDIFGEPLFCQPHSSFFFFTSLSSSPPLSPHFLHSCHINLCFPEKGRMCQASSHARPLHLPFLLPGVLAPDVSAAPAALFPQGLSLVFPYEITTLSSRRVETLLSSLLLPIPETVPSKNRYSINTFQINKQMEYEDSLKDIKLSYTSKLIKYE